MSCIKEVAGERNTFLRGCWRGGWSERFSRTEGQRFPQTRGGGSRRTLGSGWLKSIKAAASGLGVALVKMLTLERERIFVLYQHLVRLVGQGGRYDT